MSTATREPAAKVLQVSAEIFPLLKTGGLADVCGALPEALQRHGCDVRVLLPGFPAILRGVAHARPVGPSTTWPYGARVLRGTLQNEVVAYVIDASLYDREGSPYTDADGVPYADNYRRFALLGLAASRLAEGMDGRWRPDIVHAHDWHAGLAPAYLRASARASGKPLARSVYTVHNLAFQGNFDSAVFSELGLPADFYQIEGLEFHRQLSFMKAGLHYADRITTVSPTYAREIQGPDQGCGFDGVLRARSGDLVGILNGVDDRIWNPSRDPHIAERYDRSRLAGKLGCRAALQLELRLANQQQAPLFGIVSRLTEQKGINLAFAGLPELLARGGQLVVLGTGDAELEAQLRAAMRSHPRSVAARLGFDEALAHRIISGADVIMVPSRFEPGGLTQLYGLKYGTLPLVRRVGGLADTVVDCSLENLASDVATGFVFDRFDGKDYLGALRRAFALWNREKEWKRVQLRAMAQDFGWDASAAKYAEVYRGLPL